MNTKISVYGKNAEEKIEYLKKRNLKITGNKRVKKIFNEISYFRLIEKYGQLFTKGDQFKDEACLEDIIDVYKFDRKLRNLFFEMMQNVEIKLRASISNVISARYGSFSYLKNVISDESSFYKDTLNDIFSEIGRHRNNPFLKKYLDQNRQFPFSVAVEYTTFTTLSKLYKNLKVDDKKEIALLFNTKYFYLESVLENFSYIRNVCCNYDRLYAVKIPKAPKLYRDNLYKDISNNSLFASVIWLAIIFRGEVFDDFLKELLNLFSNYPKVKIYRMGFPKDFLSILKSVC